MNTLYRTLWTVRVDHAFRGGPCDDLSFVIPAATRDALAGMKALARERDGVLHVLVEVDDDGAPLGACEGRALVFGLAPRSPWFAQYTEPPAVGPGESPLFGNALSPDALDAAPRGVELVGPGAVVAPRSAGRPLDLTATTPGGAPLVSARLGAADASWRLPAGLAGEVALHEASAGPGVSRRLLVEPTLASDRPWGLLRLTATPDHVAHGRTFTLRLAARADRLRYYVVVKPTSDADFASLAVEDHGADGVERTAVGFHRVLPPFPGEGHPPLALLDPGGTRRVVLFEATSALPRRARGARGIELHRGHEVVVANLPQPGPERADARFVVHLHQP